MKLLSRLADLVMRATTCLVDGHAWWDEARSYGSCRGTFCHFCGKEKASGDRGRYPREIGF